MRFEVCFGVSEMGTPTRRERRTLGPVYVAMVAFLFIRPQGMRLHSCGANGFVGDHVGWPRLRSDEIDPGTVPGEKGLKPDMDNLST